MSSCPRPCPCSKHKNLKMVDARTYRRCAAKIASGELDLYVPSSEDNEESEEPEDNVEDPDVQDVEEPKEEVHVAFAYEIVEQVVRNRIKASGVTDMLAVFRRRYGKHLPEGMTIPKSWYTVKKLTMDSKTPKHYMRHLCPVCDYMFPTNKDKSRCKRCKVKNRWHVKSRQTPNRTALYFSLKDTVKRLVNSAPMADAILNNKNVSEEATGDRQMNDAWDGSIMHDLLELNCQSDVEDSGSDSGEEKRADGQDDPEDSQSASESEDVGNDDAHGSVVDMFGDAFQDAAYVRTHNSSTTVHNLF